MNTHSGQSLEDLQWQEHVCFVYDTHTEWAAALGRFLHAGLCRGEGCLCLLPADFFTGCDAMAPEHLHAIRQAAGQGHLLLWHDVAAFRQQVCEADGLEMLLAAAGTFPVEAGCRVVCDMNWLSADGLPEKLRFDLLEYLKAGWRDARLLVMSGYRHDATSSLELQCAFGAHRYIHHAGQILPGGVRGTPARGNARRFLPSEPGWRRIFRRSQVLDAIFKALPYAIWMLDASKTVVFLNRQACDILGGAEKEFLGRNVRAFAQEKTDGPVAAFALDEPSAYLTDTPVEREQSVCHSDGRLDEYRVIYTRVMGDDGQVQGMLGMAVDMTEWKKAKRLLTKSEQRFRDIALSVGDLIWEVGADRRFRYLSEQAESVLGCTADTLIGRDVREREGNRCEEACSALFDGLCRGSAAFRNVEKWLPRPDGLARCLLLSGVPVEEDGHFDGFRGIAEDITERKQQEQDLRAALRAAEDAHERIDSIVRSISEALVVIDNAERVVMFNPRAEVLFGSPSEQAAGRPFSAFFSESAVYDAMLGRAEGSEGEACFSWPEVTSTAQGYFKARVSRVRNRDGESTGSIVIFQDMTREREMERVKTEFISTAAHELRTPLTSVMGYLEFCMHPEEFGGFSEAQLKEFMAEIYDKAEVLERIVSDLLDISRIEAGREIPLVIETVDVAEVSRRILQHFQLQFPRYRFEMAFAADVCHQVPADREKLVQVLENLISNAVKYSATGSPVRVVGQRHADDYRISVRDRGIGMTPAQIERMFERFYRAVDANSGVRGLGLGMHIVKHIIERHGGTVEVVSAPSRGTEIMFSLPLGS